MKPDSGSPEDTLLIKHIAAIAFIYVCTTIAWMILGGTIESRTGNSSDQLQGRVASTWGTPQVQSPPSATWSESEKSGFTTCHVLQLAGSRIDVNLHLDPRQKGLLWYSTYTVEFSADYSFVNDAADARKVSFRLPFPAQHAIYDGLAMQVNGRAVPVNVDSDGASAQAVVPPGGNSIFHVAYRSQGLNSWQYTLGDKIAQAHDFALIMHTNFKDIDFADNTLSPTSKLSTPGGWELTWRYSNLVSGFQIGMTMPEKLQPGPLAGDISYAAPVSLFFFFFLMMVITAMRNIELHPMNYFFLAGAFFAFHLLLAYLVDHISIHAAMLVSSVVSVGLVVSYLRLVAGIRFAVLEAGVAQLIYLVLFSYAFFWKGFTGLSITVISVITLFVVMQATGRIRWAEKFSGPTAKTGTSGS
jgi:hypothetical protein